MGADMINMRQRKLIFALMVLLPIFAGCKSESPRAPAPSLNRRPPTRRSTGRRAIVLFSCSRPRCVGARKADRLYSTGDVSLISHHSFDTQLFPVRQFSS